MKNFALGAVVAALLCACNPQEPVPPQQPAATAAPVAPAASATSTGATAASKPGEIAVVNWNQKEAIVGTPFNVQTDGNSGISFELSQPAPAEVTVTIGGKPLPWVVSSGVIVSATIPGELLAKAGSYPVVVSIPSLGITMPAGDFVVKER